jgi:hypothetical protein
MHTRFAWRILLVGVVAVGASRLCMIPIRDHSYFAMQDHIESSPSGQSRCLPKSVAAPGANPENERPSGEGWRLLAVVADTAKSTVFLTVFRGHR